MPIATLAVLKSDWLNIPSSETALDQTLTRFITYVDGEIEAICAQPIVQRSLTRAYSGTTDALLWTGYSVPFVLVSCGKRSNYVDAFTDITAATTVVEEEGLQMLSTVGGWAAKQIQVSATVGFTSGAMPAIIQECAYEMATELYHDSAHATQGSRFGVSAIVESSGGVSYSKTIDRVRKRVREKLSPYTIIRI